MWRGALTVVLVTLAAPLSALAESGPHFEARPQLGRGGTRTHVVVEFADGTTSLRIGKTRLDLRLPTEPTVTLQEVELAGGGRVAVLTAVAGSTTMAAILSRPRRSRGEVLWSGRLSLHGDPGERTAHRIEVGDRDGDGKPDVLLGQTYERARICGQRETLVNVRAIDPRTLRLRPVSIDRTRGDGPAAIAVMATTETPGPKGAPSLRLLLPVGASSSRGFADPGEAGPPHALADGDPTTAWFEGGSAAGRGEFVSLRWDASSWPLRAVAITFPATGDAPAPPPVQSLWLLAPQGRRYLVTLPQAAQPPATRYWIDLPKPITTSCLTIAFGDVGPRPSRTLGLAEVEGYSDFDFGQGIDSLVKELSEAGPRAAEATRLLRRAGAGALKALDAAWDGMGAESRARAIRVADATPRDPGAIALLARGAEDGAEAVRDAALAGLVKAGEAAREARAVVLAEPGAGDQLAIRLARRGPLAAVKALLGAMAEPADAQRAGLREAIAVAINRHGEAAAEILDRWRTGPHPAEVRAAMAQAVAPVQVARVVASAMVDDGLEPELDFEPLWRFVKAAGHLPAQAEVDGRLASLARNDERWMLRDQALQSLAQRGGRETEDVARALLLDPYPRVRATAVRSLAALGAATHLLTKHARRDRWFIVRVATMQSMGDSAPEKKAMRAAVDDRIPVVRTAAIDGLLRVGDAAAWSAIKRHVENDTEHPQVIAAGISFARDLCIKKASPILRKVAQRGLAPNAWDPDRELALQALQALRRLDGWAAIKSLAAKAGPAVARALEKGDKKDTTGACKGQK